MSRRLWTIGDSWADPGWASWSSTGSWPAIVGRKLGLAVTSTASSGAGYSVPNPSGITLHSQATRGVGPGVDAVVCFGSVNDWHAAATPAQVGAAAAAAYAAIRESYPAAPLLVYGPQWWDAFPEVRLLDLRDAVATAAIAAGALFVDPSRWMLGRGSLLDYPVGGHPNPSGQDFLAQRIAVDVLFALRPNV